MTKVVPLSPQMVGLRFAGRGPPAPGSRGRAKGGGRAGGLQPGPKPPAPAPGIESGRTTVTGLGADGASATALQPPPHLLTTLPAPAGGGRCVRPVLDPPGARHGTSPAWFPRPGGGDVAEPAVRCARQRPCHAVNRGPDLVEPYQLGRAAE